MEGSAPSRRGGMKSRRARYFSGLLGGYCDIYQGRRSRLGEYEDEEGEQSVEEEISEEPDMADLLEGAPEASEASNLAFPNQTLVSQVEPNFLEMMEKMTQLMGKLTQAVPPGTFQEPQNSRLHQ
ncbi:hypothetical protein O181_001761 [Austropuccinia psidii MF-1]|uniref:Uncharacterized protein n=1 Tax=Austropuccinia psidii MF-1 TaxID=1389203 RepID=A0A9Q3BAU3_9BASI|nr:hypothetical protein [Austropuccinia psidii MF-1]